MLGYANDKTYSEQGVIGEECLKPECFVNDSLKNIALEYAIEGNWEKKEPDLKRLCELWKEKNGHHDKGVRKRQPASVR